MQSVLHNLLHTTCNAFGSDPSAALGMTPMGALPCHSERNEVKSKNLYSNPDDILIEIPRQARDDTEMIFQQSSLVRFGMTERSVQLRAERGSRKPCARRPLLRAAGLKILRACAGSRCIVRAVTSAAQGGSARFSRSVRRFCIAAAGFGRGCARQKAAFFLFLPLFARKRRIIPRANGKTNCMRAKFPIPAGGEVRTRDERESCFSERRAGEARRAERAEGKVR